MIQTAWGGFAGGPAGAVAAGRRSPRVAGLLPQTAPDPLALFFLDW